MDREDQISLFLGALGGGTDRDFARSMLEAHGWDLQAAVLTATGESLPPPTSSPYTAPGPPAAPAADVGGLDPSVRAPMRTGYTDTLLGPTSREEEIRRQREAEATRQRNIEERERQKKAAEQAEVARNEKTAEDRRNAAEVEALERKKAAMRAKLEEKRRAREQAGGASSATPASTETSSAAGLEAAKEPAKVQRVDPEPAAAAAATAVAEPQATPPPPQAAPVAAPKQAAPSDAAVGAPPPSKPAPAAASQPSPGPAASATEEPVAKEKEVAAVKEKDPTVQALAALFQKYKEKDQAGLATCLKTLRLYLHNLAVNPHEAKFQRINTENSGFSARVAPFEGAIDVLLASGFVREEGSASLVLPPDFAKTKGSRIWDVVRRVDVMIDQVERLQSRN